MKKVSVKGDYGFDRGIAGSEIRDLQGLLNSRRTQMAMMASNGFGTPEHKMEFVKNIRGVDFVNDAASENVNGVYMALSNLQKKAVWITAFEQWGEVGNQFAEMMEFIKNDNYFCKYYDAIYILFNTGMRISEFCGLTLENVDLKEKTISVDHQLVRSSEMEYLIQSPKTESGERKLPIRDDVAECFRNIIENRPTPAEEPVIDGVKGFLYLDKNNMPMVALHWEKYFQHIIQKHNFYNDENPLPKVTPHVCRHTYCSNMAKTGLNPKTLQYLMGHADISITLNTYTHIKFEDARAELVRSNLL